MFKIKGFLNQRKILAQLRKAINDYDMIQEGDKIAVGVSGKDSITLLIALNQIKNYYQKNFSIEAITLTLGMEECDLTYTENLCKEIGVNYTIKETDIGKIVFEERKENNPCSLCANMRRGALNNTAKALGCNKVALGHHRDDVVETFLLSTLYEGRIHTFSPVTHLTKKDIYLIRPLIYTSEKQIIKFINSNNIISIENSCKANGNTKRQDVKELIENMSTQDNDINNIVFGAIKRAGIDGW